MKERPILFSAPMVRAILAGTKTQTRRAVKPQPQHPCFGRSHMLAADDENEYLFLHSSTMARAFRSPYGKPGDRLWVRETFCDDWLTDAGGVAYRADGGMPEEMCDAGCVWRPSIHMPRSLSRITLEITDVRVERLQDISEGDAIAEGCEADYCMTSDSEYGPPDYDGHSAKEDFMKLWESINGPGSWDANPWVWVVEFKRVQA